MMKRLSIAGGVYHERCIWPEWDQVFGSAGRAAVAVSSGEISVALYGYASSEAGRRFSPYGEMGVELHLTKSEFPISFEYFHSMATPTIRPTPSRIPQLPSIEVKDEVVLRFGMMESSVKVDAEICVYDPQSAISPETFHKNGSKASRLAVLANRREIMLLTGASDPAAGARSLVDDGQAELVVLKLGGRGIDIFQRDQGAPEHVPAYTSSQVWTIGTGDVFAAVFARAWGLEGRSPMVAADAASRAVSLYTETRSLPIPAVDDLLAKDFVAVNATRKTIYLAGPFFTIAERWLVDETKRCLEDLGQHVFSPIHDVGPGDANEVVPKDIQGIRDCDAVFAIMDGLDSGTVFEVGFARALSKPVFALAQNVTEEQLKMIVGTDCRVYSDLVTAVHHAAWHQ